MDKFKITLTAKNYRLESQNYSYYQRYFLQGILSNKIKNSNVKVVSIRRKSFGYMFVDFQSTNDKTIEENYCNYYKKKYTQQEEEYISIDEDIKFNIEDEVRRLLAS